MDATFSKENRAELKVFRISLSLILLLGGGKAIHRALLRAELSQKLMFIFYLQSREGGAPTGELGEGGGVGGGRRVVGGGRGGRR